MKLTINITQTTWENWFFSATLILATTLLLATTIQVLDCIDIACILGVAFTNWIISVLVGLRKY